MRRGGGYHGGGEVSHVRFVRRTEAHRTPHRGERPQQVPDRHLHDLRRRRRYLRSAADTAGRDSRPERRASNRLYRLGRTLARPRRRPDHISDFHALHRRAEGQICPRRIDVRQIVRLCDLRGRHGYLLGALAGDRISQLRARDAARRCESRDRPGRYGRGLGLRIRARG